jgi:hypothetical protein
MAITRETQKMTLVKSNRFLYTPVGLESVVTADSFCDALVLGQDFELKDGKLELLDDKWLGKEVIAVYAR